MSVTGEAALENLGGQVAEAIARGELEHARAIIDDALRSRSGELDGEAPS